MIYVLFTRAPLYYPPEGEFLVRLACVRHAASVRSEPGSNSQTFLRIDFDPYFFSDSSAKDHRRFRVNEPHFLVTLILTVKKFLMVR